MTFDARFKRLVDQLLDGGCLPFLGAGVSQGARCPPPNEKIEPTLAWLRQQLMKLKDEPCPPEPGKKTDLNILAVKVLRHKDSFSDFTQLWHQSIEGLYPIPQSQADPANGLWSEQLSAVGNDLGPSFDRLCEVLSWCLGPARVVDALQIDVFADLSTLPAHRYLARLAREGIIEEIITTNYDRCLEKAWRYTFLDHERIAEESCPAVITDLPSYRLHGTRRHDARQRPILRIYKINGCAEAYRKVKQSVEEGRQKEKKKPERSLEGSHASEKEPETPDEKRETADKVLEEAARRIILTERQLQSFRGERWAQELLQDRTRSSTLIFSGYGSDEPQIRHTMLNLIEELGRSESQSVGDKPGCWERHNAPFISAYEATPSYAQLQFLFAYWSAHQGTSEQPRLEGFRLEHANYFDGQDGPLFAFQPESSLPAETSLPKTSPSEICCPQQTRSSQPEEPSLPADLFWERVYQDVIARLVDRHSQRSSAYFSWLKSHNQQAGAERGDLLAWLFPSSSGATQDSSGTTQASIFPNGTWLLPWQELDASSAQATPPPDTSDTSQAKNETSQATSRPPPQAMLHISRWLLAIQGIPVPERTHPWENDYYLPLREDSLLILSLLTVLMHLQKNLGLRVRTPGALEPSKNMGLLISGHPTMTANDHDAGEVTDVGLGSKVFLSIISANNRCQPTEESTFRGSACYQIVIPSLQYGPARWTLRQKDPDGRSPSMAFWRMTRVFPISASDFLQSLRKGDADGLEVPAAQRSAASRRNSRKAVRRAFAKAAHRHWRDRLRPFEPSQRNHEVHDDG